EDVQLSPSREVFSKDLVPLAPERLDGKPGIGVLEARANALRECRAQRIELMFLGADQSVGPPHDMGDCLERAPGSLDPACIELSIDLQNSGDRLGAGRYISPCRLGESVKRRLRQPERRQEVSTNTLGKHTAGKWQDANLNIALEQCSKALFIVP